MKFLLVLLTPLHIAAYISSDHRCDPAEPYNKLERPYAGGPAVNVTTRVYVRNLNTIDEGKFIFKLDYILYHWYHDPRLSKNCSSPKFLSNVRKVNDIWFPNLGLINCHSSKDVQNSQKVNIDENGNVFAHKRMTTECYCLMDLTAFPMDTQHCPLKLESYTYSQADIRLDWHPKGGIVFEQGLELVGYKQKASEAVKFTMEYSYGIWEVMQVTFKFKRDPLHFIYRAYIPVMLLMIFNFASYWIPHSAIPARVTLIITTFLTITFILQSISAQTAKATTTTSLQIFLIFSVVLVVVAILELLVVMYFSSKNANEEKEEKVPLKVTQIEVMPSPEEDSSNCFPLSAMKKLTRRVAASSTSVNKEPRKKWDVVVIDKVFRVLAPVTYILFCIIYFSYFGTYSND